MVLESEERKWYVESMRVNYQLEQGYPDKILSHLFGMLSHPGVHLEVVAAGTQEVGKLTEPKRFRAEVIPQLEMVVDLGMEAGPVLEAEAPATGHCPTAMAGQAWMPEGSLAAVLAHYTEVVLARYIVAQVVLAPNTVEVLPAPSNMTRTDPGAQAPKMVGEEPVPHRVAESPRQVMSMATQKVRSQVFD